MITYAWLEDLLLYDEPKLDEGKVFQWVSSLIIGTIEMKPIVLYNDAVSLCI